MGLISRVSSRTYRQTHFIINMSDNEPEFPKTGLDSSDSDLSNDEINDKVEETKTDKKSNMPNLFGNSSDDDEQEETQQQEQQIVDHDENDEKDEVENKDSSSSSDSESEKEEEEENSVNGDSDKENDNYEQ